MCSASQPSSRRLHAGDAQREALLAEQRVAAVARADAPDQPLAPGKCAMNRRSGLRSPSECRPFTKSPLSPSCFERDVAHAGHDPHVRDDVGAVGDLDADLAERRADRAHQVRDDVHRAALHRARGRAAPILCLRLGRAPSSCWSGPASSLRVGADEGEVLGAGDVAGVAPVQVAVRVAPRSAGEDLLLHHLADQLAFS